MTEQTRKRSVRESDVIRLEMSDRENTCQLSLDVPARTIQLYTLAEWQ